MPGVNAYNFSYINPVPVASYRYDWTAADGTVKTIITKTFPFRDKATGGKISFSLTYSVDDALSYENWNLVDMGEYWTPKAEVPILSFWYASNKTLNEIAPFLSEFLSGGNGPPDFMSSELGKPIDPDVDKKRFVFAGFR